MSMECPECGGELGEKVARVKLQRRFATKKPPTKTETRRVFVCGNGCRRSFAPLLQLTEVELVRR